MKNTLLILSLLITAPAYAQSVYKCPQPDGSIKYQGMACLTGKPVAFVDSGKDSSAPSIDSNATGLRPGEQAILDQAKQREAAKRQAEIDARREAAPVVRPYSVMDSQAWKGNERIIQESTRTINALTRMKRR